MDIRVEGRDGLSIRPYPDLGDNVTVDGKGWPIHLSLVDGECVLYVWADINQEDPTHVIDLSGASESKRVANGA